MLFNIQKGGLFSLNTTSIYSQYYIVLATCFGFTKTSSGQYSLYIQCVHTLWNPIVFT